MEQSVSIVTGLSTDSTAQHPRLELTPLNRPDKLESMSVGWFRSLGTVELREEGLLTYDRMPIAYAKCVLAERFKIEDLNDLKTGPSVMRLTEPLRMEGSPSKKADGDAHSTPAKAVQQNLFGGKKPDAGPNYKQHYSEMFEALNAKFMLTAKPKLMPMSPDKLTNCFLILGSPVPQGMTDDKQLAQFDKEAAEMTAKGISHTGTCWHCFKCSTDNYLEGLSFCKTYIPN